MLVETLAALAAAGGAAVVQAAGTDAWNGFRQAVARWFARGDAQREQADPSDPQTRRDRGQNTARIKAGRRGHHASRPVGQPPRGPGRCAAGHVLASMLWADSSASGPGWWVMP
jgi:hypothetical protein